MDESNGMWSLSPHNGLPEIAQELGAMAKKIKFYDTTLRDGEQTIGLSLDVADKLEIAKALARAGVDRIEAGFPAAPTRTRRRSPRL